MTLVEDFHRQHKERLARMNGQQPSQPDNRQIVQLTQDVAALSAELHALKQKCALHADLLGKVIATESDEKPKFGEIVDCVCDYYKVSRHDLMSARRTAELVMPRQIICYLGRHLTGMSFPQMGRRLGGRDHTTALHGANKVHDQAKTDDLLRDDLDILEMKIGAKVMERRYGANVSPPV